MRTGRLAITGATDNIALSDASNIMTPADVVRRSERDATAIRTRSMHMHACLLQKRKSSSCNIGRAVHGADTLRLGGGEGQNEARGGIGGSWCGLTPNHGPAALMAITHCVQPKSTSPHQFRHKPPFRQKPP